LLPYFGIVAHDFLFMQNYPWLILLARCGWSWGYFTTNQNHYNSNA